MSSARSKTSPTADPAFDLDYSVHDFDPEFVLRDSDFLFRRVEKAVLGEGSGPGRRTLDVACGVGRLSAMVSERGGEGWGLEPSEEMLGMSRLVLPNSGCSLARGIGEALPFQDTSFDHVICQGSLDHFVDPHAFMREAARIVKPTGSVVIALANYDSLSCRLGRLRRTFATAVLRRRNNPPRFYWQVPLDHHHKGDLSFVRGLGGSSLHLQRFYGISLLWLLHGWGHLLERLPRALSDRMLNVLDRIAYHTPSLSDTIVSVWRPADHQTD